MVKKSVSDTEKEKSRIGEVRCLNCFARYRVPPKADKFVCPECGSEWRVSWVNAELAKIRGPMWDKVEF
ncbi:MAG TPA: hypothetical protein VM075_09510 [Anaerolineae bacterium]|nr:hypothetical protein [Anaerolineae bacterium]